MKVEIVHTEIESSQTQEILNIEYDLYDLKVRFSTSPESEYLICFKHPIAFKCLDERDLMQYWNNTTINQNPIVEVLKGGFLDSEKDNHSFISDKIEGVKEFFITGIDDCLFVLAKEQPIIERILNKPEFPSQTAKQLKKLVNRNDAYFGFKEWTDHEFCIKANSGGLILFAATLLEFQGNQQEKMSLNNDELEWIDDDLEVKFIEKSNKTQKDLMNKSDPSKRSNFLNLSLWILGLFLLYLIIAGILFTFKLIASS